MSHRIAPLFALLLVVAGCSSSGRKQRVPPRFTVEQVPEAIDASRADLAAGRNERALERMRSAKNTPALPAAARQEVQVVLERAAQAVIDQSDDTGHLHDLMDVDLPRQMAVAAGMRAARLLFERGKRMKAFRLIRRLDAKFPQHPQKAAAGTLLYEIGESLANDKGRYLLIFRYRSNAPQVLEYMVMNHPSAPQGDQALWTLGRLYEQDKRWVLAIEKHQDLLLWFPDSPLAVRSQAHVPALRLRALGSPEYDRSELEHARRELEGWIGEHAGAADAQLEDQVRRDLTDSLRRLADNDLVVARFYAKVENPDGARFHARRAFETAREGGDPDQVSEAQALLESLPSGGGAP